MQKIPSCKLETRRRKSKTYRKYCIILKALIILTRRQNFKNKKTSKNSKINSVSNNSRTRRGTMRSKRSQTTIP